jgi:serine/threonine protein kinase
MMAPEFTKSGFIKGPPSRPDFLAKYEKMDKKPLGAGSCAMAWKVKKIGTEEIYVAKEFYGKTELTKPVFEPEAAALKIVDHPNCVKTSEIFGDGETGSVIVMEFINGMDFTHAFLH